MCIAMTDVSQELPGLPSSRCPHAHLVRGVQVLTKSRQHSSQARPVAVWLGVLRIPSVQSDILVTANFPCEGAIGEQRDGPLNQKYVGSKAPLVKDMLRTLTVHDWGLFGS